MMSGTVLLHVGVCFLIISGFTWLLVYQKQSDSRKGIAMKEFLNWMLKEGQKFAPELGYAPLPAEIDQAVQNAVKKIKVP